MVDNKHLVLIFSMVVILLCVSLHGRELKLAWAFGEDDLYLPEQIIVSEGEIFVFDEGGEMMLGDETIKVFSPKGEFKTKIGSKGEGPGEFKYADAFYIIGGKIFVFDQMGHKLHLFSQQSKRFIEAKKVHFPNIMSSVMNFVIMADGSVFYTTVTSIRGTKSIIKLDPGMNQVKSFRDCFPVFKSRKEIHESIGKKETPQGTRNLCLNQGYLAASGSRVYFTTCLVNRVHEFNLDGERTADYTLPLESIDKTVPVVKVGQYQVVERYLNYGMKYRDNRLYVLSRDKNGDSVVFELDEKGKRFMEKYRVKEELFGFDLAGDRLYGIEKEEARVCVYDLGKTRDEAR